MNDERIEFVPTLSRPFEGMRAACVKPAYSHRGAAFGRRYQELLEKLGVFFPGMRMAVSMGSGTLANEFLIWNFAAPSRLPLVVHNGEFGQRLLRGCRAARSGTLSLDFGWGKPFAELPLDRFLATHPTVDCICAVGCETSTGMRNDLEMLNRVARKQRISLVIDGVSLAGYDADFCKLSNVVATSASSGKALAGVPGLALVAFRPEAFDGEEFPGRSHFLSLAGLVNADGVRNTVGSLLIEALHSGLDGILSMGGPEPYAKHLTALKMRLIQGLEAVGLHPCARSDSAMVTAFGCPERAEWEALLQALDRANLGVYTEPAYLRNRALFEVAHAGNFTESEIDRLVTVFQNS